MNQTPDRAVPDIFVTPNGEKVGSPVTQVEEYEGYVEEYPSKVRGVYDPLFDRTFRFGDGSFIKNETADQFVVAVWDYFALSASTRQLSFGEDLSYHRGTGRWSRMQHMFTSTIAANLHDAEPIEVMQMMIHDVRHMLGSHDPEALFQNKEDGDYHEKELPAFIFQSGFYDYLCEIGLVEDDYFKELGLPVEAIIKPEDTNGIFHWSSSTGFMEIDRYYIGSEGLLYAADMQEVRESAKQIKRVKDSPYGDQLVFRVHEAAVLWRRLQARLQTEQWAEPLRFVNVELRNQITQYAMTSDSGDFEFLQQAHPADTLLVTNEEYLMNIQEAQADHPFVRALLGISQAVVAHQRSVHSQYSFTNPYPGPVNTPAWLDARQVHASVNDTQHAYLKGGDTPHTLVIELRPQKSRELNPVVQEESKDFYRVADVESPSDRAMIEAIRRHGNKPRKVIIDLIKYGLSPAERQSLHQGMQQIATGWDKALQRSRMNKEQMTTHLAHQRDTYRRLGKLPTQVAAQLVKAA